MKALYNQGYKERSSELKVFFYIYKVLQLLKKVYSIVIELALLPIGSVFVMDPFQAARALKLLNPKKVIQEGQIRSRE
jgi:hypothetical protein